MESGIIDLTQVKKKKLNKQIKIQALRIESRV